MPWEASLRLLRPHFEALAATTHDAASAHYTNRIAGVSVAHVACLAVALRFHITCSAPLLQLFSMAAWRVPVLPRFREGPEHPGLGAIRSLRPARRNPKGAYFFTGERLVMLMKAIILASILVLSFIPTVSAAPANDDFAGAIAVTSTPAAYTIDTRAATTEPGEFTGPYPTCSHSEVHSTVWFQVTTTQAGTMLAEADGTAYNTVLGVFKGTQLASLEFMHCSNPAYPTPPRVPWRAEPGETYYVQAGARTGDPAGTLDITFELLDTPANDQVADATIITSLPTTITGTTYGATVRQASPCHVPGTVDVWYRYTPTEGTVLNTAGVEVFEGTTFEDLVTIDDCGNDQTATLAAGTSYSLRVDASKWEWGPFNISLAATPANDARAAATPIASYPSSASAQTTSATSEPGEHLGSFYYCNNAAIGNTVWYKLTVDQPTTLTANLDGTDYDALAAVYTGADYANDNLIHCSSPANPADPLLAWDAVPGTTYYVQVGAVDQTPAGNLAVTFDAVIPPANNHLADAQTVTALPATLTGTTVGATFSNINCSDASTVDVWFKYTPTEDQYLIRSALTAFTLLPNGDPWAVDNCRGDSKVQLTAGQTYYLRYAADHVSPGPFSIDAVVAPINDEQENALAIQPYTNLLAETTHATVSSGEDQPCRIHRTLWYKWEPTSPGLHRVAGIQQGGTGMAIVAVYAEDAGRQTLRSCETQPSTGTRAITDFYATPGTTYYFQVGIEGAANAGDVQFTLSKLPPTNTRPATLVGPILGGMGYYI